MNFVGVVHEYIQMYELDGTFLFALPNQEKEKLNLITESILERKMLALTLTIRNKISKQNKIMWCGFAVCGGFGRTYWGFA